MNSISRWFTLIAIPNPMNEERRIERTAFKLSYKSEKRSMSKYIYLFSPSPKYLQEVKLGTISSYNSIKYMS